VVIVTRAASTFASRLLLAFALGLALPAAQAQSPADIPRDAPGGKLTVVAWPVVQVDGKPMRATPGARILRPDRLTVTPNQLPPGTPVRYRLDTQGQIEVIWIVGSTDEQVRSPASGGPRR
jgi:hypothetical protein